MGALQRLQNHRKNAIRIQQHIVVPESQHPIAARRKFIIPTRVIFLLRQMLTAIYLDDELRFHARKIGNVIADRHLSPKAIPRQLSIAQKAPQMSLGGGR